MLKAAVTLTFARYFSWCSVARDRIAAAQHPSCALVATRAPRNSLRTGLGSCGCVGQ